MTHTFVLSLCASGHFRKQAKLSQKKPSPGLQKCSHDKHTKR